MWLHFPDSHNQIQKGIKTDIQKALLPSDEALWVNSRKEFDPSSMLNYITVPHNNTCSGVLELITTNSPTPLGQLMQNAHVSCIVIKRSLMPCTSQGQRLAFISISSLAVNGDFPRQRCSPAVHMGCAAPHITLAVSKKSFSHSLSGRAELAL